MRSRRAGYSGCWVNCINYKEHTIIGYKVGPIMGIRVSPLFSQDFHDSAPSEWATRGQTRRRCGTRAAASLSVELDHHFNWLSATPPRRPCILPRLHFHRERTLCMQIDTSLRTLLRYAAVYAQPLVRHLNAAPERGECFDVVLAVMR